MDTPHRHHLTSSPATSISRRLCGQGLFVSSPLLLPLSPAAGPESAPSPPPPPARQGILAKQRGMEGRRGCLDGISDLWIPDAGPGGGSGSLPPASRIPAHLPGKRTPALPVCRPGLGRCHPGKGSRVASSSAGRGWDGPPQARFCSVGGSDYNDSGACFSSISCEQGPGLRSQYASSHLFLKTGPGPLSTTNFPSATKVDRKHQSHCYPPY